MDLTATLEPTVGRPALPSAIYRAWRVITPAQASGAFPNNHERSEGTAKGTVKIVVGRAVGTCCT